MKRSSGILVVAIAHLVCSWLLFFVSVGIGMKSFDSPHALTSNEKFWTSVARIMLLPIADPLHHLSKPLAISIMTDSSYGGSVRSLSATVWFLVPLILNSVLWSGLFWWVYSGVTRNLGRVKSKPI